MDRRTFLQHSGALGLALAMGASSCASAAYASRQPSATLRPRRLPKARVSLDRVIKETVGLRPFRVSGPRLDTEMLDHKTIIHNYGHGGSGFSLSWGTGNLAAGKAAATGEREIAVLGCGIMGLTTARLLQNRGLQVNIYTKDLAPNLTSSMATGTWSPAHLLCEPEHLTPALKATWEQACLFSFRTYQNLLGLGDLVAWVDNYVVGGGAAGGRGEEAPIRLSMPGLLPERVLLTKKQNPFKAEEVSSQPTLMFNIPSYLQKLTGDFLSFGGKVHIREFTSLEQVDALPERCIVNCTGLGSKALFQDEHLLPIAGQLSFLIPQPEINYRLSTPNGYLIPRKDGLVLGGNAIKGSWDTTPTREQTEKVVAAIQGVMQNMRG
jgi:D-amino-acid oxidase